MLTITKTKTKKLISENKTIPFIFYIEYILFYIYNMIYPNTQWFKLDAYLFAGIIIGCLLIYLSSFYLIKYEKS